MNVEMCYSTVLYVICGRGGDKIRGRGYDTVQYSS